MSSRKAATASALACANRTSAESRARAGTRKMATFNRIFTTERLLQIICVLTAALIMKLMS